MINSRYQGPTTTDPTPPTDVPTVTDILGNLDVQLDDMDTEVSGGGHNSNVDSNVNVENPIVVPQVPSSSAIRREDMSQPNKPMSQAQAMSQTKAISTNQAMSQNRAESSKDTRRKEPKPSSPKRPKKSKSHPSSSSEKKKKEEEKEKSLAEIAAEMKASIRASLFHDIAPSIESMESKLLDRLLTRMDQSHQTLLSRLEDLERDRQGSSSSSTTEGSGSQPEGLVSPMDLPPFDPSNPWKAASLAPIRDGKIHFPDMPPRPISDFEPFPPTASLPYCWVRLRPDASVLLDRIPKETVIYPQAMAQNYIRNMTEELDMANSTKSAFGGSLCMFKANTSTPTPFTTKVLGAVLEASAEGKTASALREEDKTSLLFPQDDPRWAEVDDTFSVQKLKPDCASSLFNEDLPAIPNNLLTEEFAARQRLARTLHTMTVSELGMVSHPDWEILKVITKSMVASLRHDLTDFVQARKKCRAHVLEGATVRHEPNKLIGSSIWGASLFPDSAVKEVMAELARSNTSLSSRWSMKRKYTPGSGPQPKSSFKRFRREAPRSSPQQLYKLVPSGSATSAPANRQLLVAQAQPSPAFNPRFESKQSSFRSHPTGTQARGSFGGRRGRRGQGTGRLHQAPRGKPVPRGRGSRPQRRGQ